MFESLHQTLDDLLGGRVTPAARHALLGDMKRALAQARLGIEDLHTGLVQTERRLAAEREALATTQRRRNLAAAILDTETVAVAERFMAQHAERVAVLEHKLDAQRAELGLAEREVHVMMKQFRLAAAGAGNGIPAGAVMTDADLGLADEAPLRTDLDALFRAAVHTAREQAADARLAELKRKLGRQ